MFKIRKRNQAVISVCLSLLMVFSFINTLVWAEGSSFTGTSASSGDAGTTGGGGTGDGSGTAGTAESGGTGDGSGAGGTVEGGASVDGSGAGGTAEGGASVDTSGAGGTAEGGASGDGSGAGQTTDGSVTTDTGTNDSAAGTGGSSSDQQDDSLNPAEGTGQEEEVELAAPPVMLSNLPAIALPEPIQVAGSASDSTVTMAKGNIEVDASDNTWEIILSSGTLKSSPGDEISSELSVSGIPSGLSLIAVNGGSNNIIITVSGLAAAEVSTRAEVGVSVLGSAVLEEGAGASDCIKVYIDPPRPQLMALLKGGAPTVLYDWVPIGDFKYDLYSDGTAKVVKYTGPVGPDQNIIIPEAVAYLTDGYTVTAIDLSVFYELPMNSVIIPSGVARIPVFGFAGSGVKSVFFTEPGSLNSIDARAFAECPNLSSIIIPGTVSNIGDNAFYGCSGLLEAVFGGPKPTLGSGVFTGADANFTLYYHVTNAASWSGYTDYNATPFCNLTLMDGGTVLSSGRTALDKTSYTLSRPADPTGGSGTFLGWYTAADTPYDFTTPVSDDLTLYAIWESPGVCSITSGGTTTDYATLDDALAAVKTGESIKLLQDISYNGGLSVSGKLINFELNGYNLNVSNTSGTGLEVGSGGGVSVTGSGQFNVTGTDYGVYAHDGGLAAVTSATSTGATGTGAKAASGGQITVNGSVSGASGVFATGSGSSITVNGGVSGTDENGSGAWAAGGASINISGDVQGGVYGVHAINAGSVIKVGGSVTATNLSGAGAYADNGGSITVGGNSVGTGGSGIGACALAGSSITVTGDVQGVYSGVTVQGNSEVFVGGNVYSGQYGVIARSGGEATIDGIISVGAGTAIAIGSGTYNVITPTTKDGYITYSDGTSTVWVKDNAVVEPTTFVLSNEEGNEIDWYQYSGYAGFSMYQFLVKIQEYSNGVITDEFLAALAACPANSAIFTTRLYDYRGQTQSICINSDGTVKLLDILGRDYYGRTGFTTCWDNRTNSGAFTYTNDPACYIDAGTNSSGESYKAFAVYWAPILENRDVATFVLTNEAGGLVDQLIADGYGDYNVYQTLELLKPSSGGVITDEFMASLAACPADSEIFTVPLTTFVVNYPLCINEDGTLHISPIYGRDLYQKPGYASYPDSSTATMMFTYPTSADYLVYAGSSGLGRGIYYHYKAFAIAWSPAAGSSAPAAPTIIPNGGTFTNSVGVTITGTGGTIYYTTDGTDPRESGTRIKYIGQFTLTSSAAVKAAVQGEAGWSEVASGYFTITTGGVDNSGGGGGGSPSDSQESVNTTPEQVEAPNEPGVKNPAAEPTDLNGHWAHDCIMALIANGIIRGYPDGTIRPEQEITRAEAAVLLVLSLGLQDYQLQSSQSPYNDYLPAWAQKAILICTEKGLMKGYPDGSFKPDQHITRAEMCVALIQAYPQVMQPGYTLAFTDRDSIPEWARTFIERAAANQLVGGYPDGTFQPDAFIKRAEVFTIICHLKGYHSQHSS